MNQYATLSVQRADSVCDRSFSVQVQGRLFQGVIAKAMQPDRERDQRL